MFHSAPASSTSTLTLPSTSTSTLPLERWRRAPNGRVRDGQASGGERVAGVAMHLWPLAMPLIGPFAPLIPLVLWIAMRRSSPFVDDHGRECINTQIMILILLVVPCIGWIALIPWMLVWIVSLVRGAVAAAGCEIFRYPMVLRVLR